MVTEQLGETGEISSKVEKIEEKINSLQKEVTNLIGSLPNAPKKALSASVKEQGLRFRQLLPYHQQLLKEEPFVILRCKQWE